METLKPFILDNYIIILVIAILSFLALIGYLVDNFGRKDFKVKKDAGKVVSNTKEEFKMDSDITAETNQNIDAMSGLKND